MENETYLTFKLGQELFAVNVANVLEVLEKQPITAVPRAPQHILGIINFRGNILPVVNTRLKFNLAAANLDIENILIVFEIKNTDDTIYSIAATADAVKNVIEIAPNEIKPIPEMGISYDARFIKGAIRRDENFILILETEKVFSIVDLEVLNNQ
jgi:purine-binding chemotaxis protein CheW